MSTPAIFLAAGGTGGHLFPAEALSLVLQQRGFDVELITDHRGKIYGASFPARAVHEMASATPMTGGVLRKIYALVMLGMGLLAALWLFVRRRPVCVIGFGGYPTVPPLVAAFLLRIPCYLHEQNAVMGRANVFLARFVDGIATGFPTLKRLPAVWQKKLFYCGNPVRPAVVQAAQRAYDDDVSVLRILVTGGSQGARVMAQTVPAALALLDANVRARLKIVQQARGEDETLVRTAYQDMHIDAVIKPFFADLPHEIAQAHLVIARAGASTVSELAVIGRPSILVPFPHALDQDQAHNAAFLKDRGAAVVIEQDAFTPRWLADKINALLATPTDLVSAAQAARTAAKPDAAQALADYIISALANSAASGADQQRRQK